jgi:hypothetical protein
MRLAVHEKHRRQVIVYFIMSVDFGLTSMRQILVWKTLQMWANTVHQSYYGTVDPLNWDGDDRPSAVNEPRSLNYYNKYMASKPVDVQFAIY